MQNCVPLKTRSLHQLAVPSSIGCPLSAVKVWSLNCSSDHCNVSVKEGGNVTICSEMGPRSGEESVPVNSSKWVSMVFGGRMEMMSQCQEETKCCNKGRSVFHP